MRFFSESENGPIYVLIRPRPLNALFQIEGLLFHFPSHFRTRICHQLFQCSETLGKRTCLIIMIYLNFFILKTMITIVHSVFYTFYACWIAINDTFSRHRAMTVYYRAVYVSQ